MEDSSLESMIASLVYNLKTNSSEPNAIAKTSMEVENRKKISAVYREDQFKVFFALAGQENTKKLVEMALRLNQENVNILKNENRNTLIEKDKIRTIQNAKTGVRTILKANREKLASLNFMVNETKNIADFAHHIIPLDSLFRATNQELITYNIGDVMPERITQSFYDMALLEVRDYLFEKKDPKNILERINIATQNSRDKFETYNVKLFHCYTQYGEACFEGRNFDCYLEKKQLPCR